jgi:hypothetical protein
MELGRRMSIFRIALANIEFPATPEESIALAKQAIAQAAIEQADLICFPECFIPGYRGMGKLVPPPDPAFLEAIRKRYAGPFGAVLTSCSIRISTKPSPAVTGLRVSPIPRTHSMRKQPCVAPPRTPAFSQL